jgi:hypothetical protein
MSARSALAVALLAIVACTHRDAPEELPRPIDAASLESAPDVAGARLQAPAELVEWLTDAKRVARAEHGVSLFLDSRDADVLPTIVDRVRARHIQSPLAPDVLRSEVSRWGAACGQIVAAIFSPCHWGPAKDRNLGYGHSLWVPTGDGPDDWLEDDCFDLVERLITEPERADGLAPGRRLGLHFLD